MTRVPHKSSSPASPARMVRQMLRTVVACRESRTCIPLHFLLSDLWLARRNFTFTQKHQMLFKAVPAATQRNSAKVPVVLRLLSCLGERAAGSNNLHLDFSFICWEFDVPFYFSSLSFLPQLQLEHFIVWNSTPQESISNLGSHWCIKNSHFKGVGQGVPCNQRQLKTFPQLWIHLLCTHNYGELFRKRHAVVLDDFQKALKG